MLLRVQLITGFCVLDEGLVLLDSLGANPLVAERAFCASDYCQARKKSTKINFLGPETARWGGDLPLEGVVAENFVPALESLSSLGFEERNLGCPGNFAGMSRTPGGVQKVYAKKLRAHLSFPICASDYLNVTTVSHVQGNARNL